MSKIVKSDTVSLDADETIANVLTGTKLENVPSGRDYVCDVYATASDNGVRHKLEADTDVAIQESALRSDDRIPIVPDDFVESFAVEGGSKLFLEVRETTGSAQTYYYTIRLRPIN